MFPLRFMRVFLVANVRDRYSEKYQALRALVSTHSFDVAFQTRFSSRFVKENSRATLLFASKNRENYSSELVKLGSLRSCEIAYIFHVLLNFSNHYRIAQFAVLFHFREIDTREKKTHTVSRCSLFYYAKMQRY